MVEIIISVAAKVTEYLVDPIIQFSYTFNYHRHLQDLLQKIDNLGDRRRRVEELAEEAIRQGDQIFADVQEWLDATEAILQTREDFVREERQASQQGCFHLKYRYNLGKTAKRQGEVIDAKLQQAHGFGRDTVSNSRPPPSVPSCASSTNDADLPSRQSILDQIMEALRNEQTSKVGVWGMGGVGKTTLALKVAKRAEEEKLFNKVVMASSISQTPIISKIQTQLANTLGLRFREGQDRSVDLMNSMMNQKKILVILDDIWSELDLRIIGIPFGDDHKGCKLLLTSREYEVVATDMEARPVVYLPHLEASEAWSLFKRTVGDFVEESPELKATADDIVRKCEGLPIAIITIAKALKNKSEGEWKNALKELIMAKPTNIRGMTKNVYSCVELSYNHLEGNEVKSVFLLCGLLGGRLISKDHLLLYATGLKMFEGMYSMEDSANKLITLVGKLIASSLLLEAEEEDGVIQRSLFFDDPFVKMHDVVRDVARSIVRRQYVVSEAVELREWEGSRESWNYSGISLECEDQNELPPRLVCPELELFFLNSSFDPSPLWQWKCPELRILDDFFQGITKLRVLHMSAVSLRPSPSSLGFLTNLRTLCLIRCILQDMTCIGEMKGLQVLSLARSDIVELPKEIGQLKDLRVLDLGFCRQLRIIPRNVISSLSGLECLNLRACRQIEWGRDGESNNRACLSEVKNLPRLRTFEVVVLNPSVLPNDNGLDLVNLTRYVIRIGDDSWRWPMKHLSNNFSRNFIMVGVKTPVLKSLSNLFNRCQLLSLDGLASIRKRSQLLSSDELASFSERCQLLSLGGLASINKRFQLLSPEELDGISNVVYDLANENGFSQLEYLIIQRNTTIRHIVSSSGWHSQKWTPPCDTFCCLDKLKLSHLPNLESVFDFHESAPILIECFGKLRSVSLQNCQKLRSVMSLPMQHGRELNFFPRLQKLKLLDLPNLTSFYSTTTIEHSAVPMSILLNQKDGFLLQLECLSINGCGTIRHIISFSGWPSHKWIPPRNIFSRLDRLELVSLPDLESIFDFQESAPILIEPFGRLRSLYMRRCEKLRCVISLPTQHDIELTSFPRLQTMVLFDLPHFSSFYSIALDNQVPISIFDQFAFPALEELEVVGLGHHLRALWHNQFSADSFSKLKKLKIIRWHEQQKVFPTSLVKALVQLEELNIKWCESVEEIVANKDHEDIEDDQVTFFPKLAYLSLEDLVLFKRFCSRGIKLRLPLLKKLSVVGCGDQVRTVFKEISLEGEVDAQPLFFVEKEDFPDIESLFIEDLNGVVEIWRGQFSRVSFSKLRVLAISNCQDISFVISKNMVQTLHNLESLCLGECDSMKEVIQLLDDEPTINEIHFNKLKSLIFFDLPNLEGFCTAICTFRFPSLETLDLFKCPKMEFFCRGDLHIEDNALKENILEVLHSNMTVSSAGYFDASYENDESDESDASNIASTSQDSTA